MIMEFKKSVKGIRYILNDEVLKRSTSGGAFVALANYFLSRGGSVYGAAFDENNVVRHIRVVEQSELSRLQGSKYVQSRLGECFTLVKRDLENGMYVLFTGTPCQVAGIRQYLQHDYDNLLTLDFTCHGVPSPLFFSKYLQWLEKKYGEPIKQGDYTFRVKKHGWYYRRHMSYTLKVGSHYGYVWSDPYYANFLKAVDYRESCYSCPFKLNKDAADITVGDFNGVDIVYPDFFDKRGVSYAVLNTEKGQNFLSMIMDAVTSIDIDYTILKQYNKTLSAPVKRPTARSKFYNGLCQEGFVERKNEEIPIKSRLKPYIPYFVEKILKL